MKIDKMYNSGGDENMHSCKLYNMRSCMAPSKTMIRDYKNAQN